MGLARHVNGTALAALVGFAGFTGASRAAYSFTDVADTTSGVYSSFNPFSQNLSLNENGQVAFGATLAAGGTGVFRGSGGAVTTIGTTLASGLSDAHTGINDSGLVTYFYGGTSTIFAGSGGPGSPATLYDSTSGYTPHYGPSINN